MKEQIKFLEDYCQFVTDFDVYVLIGVARRKDNESITNSQEVVFREVIKSQTNIAHKYTKIKSKCESYRNVDGKKLNFYIYISVNSRCARKGYMEFKKKQLNYEVEMFNGVPCDNQLKRMDSIWLSALMSPASRSKGNRRFLLDIDSTNTNHLKKIKELYSGYIGDWPVVIRNTKNGYHYVIYAFNIQAFNKGLKENDLSDICEVKTDALLFMEHIEL